MQSQLYSVSKIFSEKIYRIPDYQRGFAWGHRQLKDYWNDLMQLEEGKNHYCGVVTLESVDKAIYRNWEDDVWIIESKNYEPYFVVDGQQRLTTTIILIQAIIETMPSDSKLNFTTLDKIKEKFIFEIKETGYARSYIFGYERDNPSYEFLKTSIFLENSSSNYRSEETIYTHNLINAKNFFIEQLSEFSFEQKQQVYKKVTQHLLFNIYTIASDIDVFVAFETMNNRGKPLSNLELLKNRLIYLTTKMAIDETDQKTIRKTINDSWKAIYHYLGKDKDIPLYDDTFLATHFLVYVFPNTGMDIELLFKYDINRYRRSNEYADYLFDRKFSSRRLYELEDKITVNEIVDYVDSLQRSVITWYYINFPQTSNYSKEEKKYLSCLKKLEFEKVAAFLLSVFNRKIKKELKIELLKNLDRLLLLDSMMYLPDNGLKGINLSELSVITYSYKPMEYERVLRETINAIADYCAGSDVYSGMKKRIASMNFYRWNGIYFFLYEYECHLQELTKNKTSKLEWKDFNIDHDDYVTIEHIYPQKATDESWKSCFNEYTLKNRRFLCDSLGNLLALSKPKNSSLQNKPFVEKKENGKNYIGYRYGSYSEIDVAKYDDWTPLKILNRGVAMLEFMEKRWGLNLGNRKKKIELLGLDFVKTA